MMNLDCGERTCGARSSPGAARRMSIMSADMPALSSDVGTRWDSCAGELAAEHERDELRLRSRVDLAHGVPQMRLYRALGNSQIVGDLMGPPPHRDLADDLELARAKHPGLPRVCWARSDRLKTRIEHDGENQVAAVEADPAHRVLHRHPLTARRC